MWFRRKLRAHIEKCLLIWSRLKLVYQNKTGRWGNELELLVGHVASWENEEWCNIGYPPETHFKSNLAKSLLPITCCSVVKSFWNFAQPLLGLLSCCCHLSQVSASHLKPGIWISGTHRFRSFFRALQWRHNGCDGVSNHQPLHCSINCLFRSRSKKTSKPCVAGLCARNSSTTGEFPAQLASYAESVSIWWRHHEIAETKLCVHDMVPG